MHTAENEAAAKLRQEGPVCRDRVREYLAEKQRREEEERRAKAEAERQRRDAESRDRERQRQEQEAQRRDEEYRTQQTIERNKRQERWDREQEQQDREAADFQRSMEEANRIDREAADALRNQLALNDQAMREQLWEQQRERDRQREFSDAIERIEQERKERARQEQARREAQQREEQRQEALRQAHNQEVTKAAQQVKEKWQEEIRNNMPDVATDLSGFRAMVQDMRQGRGAYSAPDLTKGFHQLFERAMQAYKWISMPVATAGEAVSERFMKTTLDAVRAEAMDKVWTDRDFKRDDPLIQSIFGRIQQVNAKVHALNPFTEKVSSLALEQIEVEVQHTQRELAVLEANLGSFHASQRYLDRPIANPFKVTSSNSGSLENGAFRSLPPNGVITITESGADCTNPFEDCRKKILDRSVPTTPSKKMEPVADCTNPLLECGKVTSNTAVSNNSSQAAKESRQDPPSTTKKAPSAR